MTKQELSRALGMRISHGRYERMTTRLVANVVPARKRKGGKAVVGTLQRMSPKWLRKHKDTYGDNNSRRSRYERYEDA